MRAGWVTVPMCVCVCMCVCMYVCVYVCVCGYVHSNLLPHTLESQKRDTNGFIAIQELISTFPNFLKCFVQKLWRNLPTSSSSGVLVFFFHEISFNATFEDYSYIFTAQTTRLWKTVCGSLAQTRERYRYTDH